MTLFEPITTRPGCSGMWTCWGKSAEDGAFEHAVVRAEGRALLDRHPALQDAASADDRARLDDAEGTDLDIRRRFGPRD